MFGLTHGHGLNSTELAIDVYLLVTMALVALIIHGIEEALHAGVLRDLAAV